MIFNSFTFVIFLAIVLPLYYALPRRGQNVLLLVSSYVFYGWWDYRFTSLLLLSTVIDYWAAIEIDRAVTPFRKKLALVVSMSFNLGTLCFFKYFNFFLDSTIAALQTLGLHADAPTLNIILPVGISFYTFQTMSYTIDVYRGQCHVARSLLDFAVYVAFFPQLVAGPIERAVHLLPQVERIRRIDSVMVIDGIWLIILGYLKKTVIADRIAEYSDQAFSSGLLPFEGMGNWLCLYAFAIQIYGDFSGYSDIARGLSKIMGFDLMVNFRSPYLVSNPPAFWQNWHISLSTWLRDYLYIPLGGNRHGQPQMYRNLMITMILGGLWHRAAWACLIWGIYQGALLVVHRAMLPMLHRIDGTLEQSRWLTNIWKLVSIVVFFHLTCIGWLIFRVGSTPAGTDQVAMITDALRTLFTPEAFTGLSSMGRALLFTGALTFLVQWKDPIMESFHTWKPWPQAVSVAVGMLLVTALGVFDGAQFIYFQF